MHQREKERRFDSELVACVEKIEVREEGPAEEIRKEARDGACDLIVMGTHGKGALEATFMGSVAPQGYTSRQEAGAGGFPAEEREKNRSA